MKIKPIVKDETVGHLMGFLYYYIAHINGMDIKQHKAIAAIGAGIAKTMANVTGKDETLAELDLMVTDQESLKYYNMHSKRKTLSEAFDRAVEKVPLSLNRQFGPLSVKNQLSIFFQDILSVAESVEITNDYMTNYSADYTNIAIHNISQRSGLDSIEMRTIENIAEKWGIGIQGYTSEFGVGPLFNSGGIQGNNYGLSSERKSKTKKRTTRKKGKRYYSKLKVGQLKKILKEKGLPVGGVKGELVERLTDNSWKKKQQTPWNERQDVRKSKKKRHAISLQSKSHEFLWSQNHIIFLASTFLVTWILFGDAILAIMCTIAILILQMLDHAWNEQGRYGER